MPKISYRLSTKDATIVTLTASLVYQIQTTMKANTQNIIYEYRFATENGERSALDHMSSLNMLRSTYDSTSEEDKFCIRTESLVRIGSIFIIGLISYLLVLIF